MLLPRFSASRWIVVLLLSGATVLAACGGGEKVVEVTRIVEKPVTIEKVVQQTVIVEKQVLVVPTEALAPKAAAPTLVPQPTTAPVVAQGVLRVAAEKVEPPIFRVYLSGRGFSDALLTRFGVFEGFLRANHSDPPNFGALGGGGIGTEWAIAPDQSKITFQVRKGVKFHGGWGEITAKDIEWSFNDALGVNNKGEPYKTASLFTRAATQATWASHWEAIGDYTVALYLKKLDPQWAIQLANSGNTTTPLVSKKAFDDLGSEKFNTTDMGTGPFVVDKWETGNKLEVSRFAEYWNETARVQRVVYLDMPEQSTKQAALEAGEIDIATGVDSRVIKSVTTKINGSLQKIGPPGNIDVNFAGNYWASFNRDSGKPWPRQPGFKPDKNHPWIGDPFKEGGNDMESARKVRWALAMAIDRKVFVEQLLAGLGQPGYTLTGVRPGQEIWKNEWLIPYDVAKAKQLLAEAGYPNGFKITLRDTAASGPAQGEAIGQMWAQIGVETKIDALAYDAARPEIVNRTLAHPWLWGWNYSLLDEAKGIWVRPSTGFSRGYELPDNITDLTYANFQEQDRQKRIQNNIKLQDYLTEQMLTATVAHTDGALFVVAKTVERWRPHQSQFGFFNSPETVVLKK